MPVYTPLPDTASCVCSSLSPYLFLLVWFWGIRERVRCRPRWRSYTASRAARLGSRIAFMHGRVGNDAVSRSARAPRISLGDASGLEQQQALPSSDREDERSGPHGLARLSTSDWGACQLPEALLQLAHLRDVLRNARGLRCNDDRRLCSMAYVQATGGLPCATDCGMSF